MTNMTDPTYGTSLDRFKTIPSLNGLRALSVMMVIFYHLQFSNDHIVFSPWLQPFFNGQLGVNIFFVISGFLITTLLLKENNRTGYISLKGFYFRRVLRIFPAYYFLLFVYYVLQIAGVAYLTQTDWIVAIFYLKQFFNEGGISGHLWSLSVEEFFYFFYPIALISFYSFQNKKFSWALLLLALIVFPFLRVLIGTKIPMLSGYNILMRGDSLVLGCLLALNYDPIIGFLSRLKYLAYLAVVFLVVHQYLFSILHLKLGFIWLPFGYPGWSLFDNICICIIIAACIENGNTWYYRMLNTKILNFIGALSYSLYLWQQLFTSEGKLGILNQFPYNLGFTFLAALASYYLIERQCVTLK